MTMITLAIRREQDSPGVNLMPPVIFFSCLITGSLLEFLIPIGFFLQASPLLLVAGLLLGGFGFVFMLTAHTTFERIGTYVHTNRPATTLVTQGAYRFSRNPMYLGGSAFFLGIALTAGSLWLMAAYLPLGLYLALYVIPREEAYMTRAYGDGYRAYCRRVRRWI
ncbi:MAG: isoprenylcysteine carboxylmethyltransferase family protein [Desulfobacterales bacterium]|nr:isoprenylcysteine carboxylmethyltransferase family protein [Desulfobacterales bacterium]